LANRILVTGGTGYVGGRLIALLEQQGVTLRCLARNPPALLGRVKASTEIVEGDVLDPGSLERVMAGIDTAYYLIHAMGSSGDFERKDKEGAENFARAAHRCGVNRIIYLGGLGEDTPQLSPHLRSRHEVGDILRSSGIEVIEFRTSMVLGAGSLSYRLVRSLTERLPIMICPRWVSTPTQPIAIDDILAYLLAAKELPQGKSRIFEVGGADIVGYGDIMREYARQRGLRRILISVPVLTPWLSSLWLALVTPATAEVGKHLIEGLRNPTVVRDPTALEVFPIRPMGICEGIKKAITEATGG